MDNYDIVYYIAKKLRIKYIILLSKVNKLCYLVCSNILANTKICKYVKEFTKITTMTHTGEFIPTINVNKLFYFPEAIPKELFLIKPFKSRFFNCIILRTTNLKHSIKIFKNNMFQISGVTNNKQITAIYEKFKKLFNINNFPILDLED